MRCVFMLTALAMAGVASAKPLPSGRGRVAVVPVVPVGPGVLDSAAGSMTEALLEELGNRGVLAEGKARVSGNATKLIEDGRRELQRMQVPKAITALEGALALTDDPKQQAQASLLLAEAYYRRGDEAKGREALAQVARSAPDTTLSPERYPPVFVKAFEDVKANTPPAAAVPKDNNLFDAGARAQALSAGKSAGADYVIVAGMARGERLFTLEAYAGHVRTGRWMALPVGQPDFDMLSASVEASKIVRELETFRESTLDGVLVHNIAPAAVQDPVSPIVPELDRDSALAADYAAINNYDTSPVVYDRVEKKSDGITSKWYFWVGAGIGAALIGGTVYYLATHEGSGGNTVSVQAAW